MTDEERQNIKDEILRDVQQIVRANVPETRKKTKLPQIINSPIVIALVTGGLLNLFITRWQDNAAKIHRAEARAIELQERKQKLFVEFADNFCQSAALAQSYKLREAWLRSPGLSADSKELYRDGRTFSATVVEAERLKGEFLKSRMPDSMCNQIETCFQSPIVLKYTESLRVKCDLMIDSFDAQKITTLANEINADYQQLLTAMTEELRKSNL